MLELSKEVAQAKPATDDEDLNPDDFIVDVRKNLYHFSRPGSILISVTALANVGCLFIWQVVQLDYGRKKSDPINKVLFYSKKEPTKPIKILKHQVHTSSAH